MPPLNVLNGGLIHLMQILLLRTLQEQKRPFVLLFHRLLNHMEFPVDRDYLRL